MAQESRVTKLIEDLKSDDPEVRTAAWLKADEAGPGALKPLADLVSDGEMEVSRAAKRAMWKIVRSLGSPQSSSSLQEELVEQLQVLLTGSVAQPVRREALWMFSEVSSPDDAKTLAPLLRDAELREDARCALERIPGEVALEVLRQGLAQAPDEFKMNIVQSLRARGEEVPGHPCQKLVPGS